ncbi:anti-anti-sigma factor [Hamadaea flava]|uniref:STAS domain-containing protein n=1 Tax=Hamadaea flava TaxID=1742688 RepID=A0ABV8LY28_9ACTN|nr:STAS domain-containing protein [Hamadaea flava]MCP2329244.1 anti-anti-sigma factor [Hamadaea flava]
MLTITDRWEGPVAYLVLAGELDLLTGVDLLAATEKVSEATEIIVDCHELRFCDSSGIGTLLQARESARAAGADLRLTGVTGLVHRVLLVTGVLTELTGEGPISDQPPR